MKLTILAFLLSVSASFGQGTRFQSGGVPTPVPVFNFNLISNQVYIMVTNIIGNTVTNSGGLGSLTNLTIAISNNLYDRFLFVNTNAATSNQNQTISYDSLVTELESQIGGTTNGQTAAQVGALIKLTNDNIFVNLYDIKGRADAVGLNTTNLFTKTNDTRALSLSSSANLIQGTFQGIVVVTNNTFSTSYFTFGQNVDGSFLTVDGFGSTYDQFKLHPGGILYVSPSSAGNISGLLGIHAPLENSGDWSAVYQPNSLYTPPNASVGVGQPNQVSGGAPHNLAATYVAASASSMVDLPMKGPEIWSAQPHPWLSGVHTDVAGGVAEDGTSWALQQIVYTNLIAVSKWYNTSGWNAAVSPYGIRTGIWGDAGWATNRTSSHSLQFDAQLLTASSTTSFSNYVYQIHTNGVGIGLLEYRTTQPYNLFNSDNAMVWVVKSDGSLTEVSYPSGAGATNPPTIPFTTPNYVRSDIDFYYSNAVDRIILADVDTYGLENGYAQQLQAFAWSAMFPDTSVEDHVYWANVQTGSAGPLTADIGSTPGVTGSLSNQLIIAAFVNNTSPSTAYLVNEVAFDQVLPGKSADVGLSRAMAYFNTAFGRQTNWPARSGIVEMSAGFDDTDANHSGLSLLSITNYYAVALMGHMGISWDVDTNRWTPNTNIMMVLGNTTFLSSWADNMLAQPQPVFNDQTNELFVRAMDGGAFLVMGVNQQNAANTNMNQVISGSKSGLALIPTNQIFTATNVMTQTAWGSGLFTNSFIGTIPSNNVALVRLTSYGISGATIVPGTLPSTAFDSSVPPRQNYLHITQTNSSSAGFIPYATGTNDAFGSPVSTNGPPPSGTTPNGLVTNNAIANIVVTNALVNTTITSNSVTTPQIKAPFNTLTFVAASNSFTNIIIGYFVVTNGDGRKLVIPCGTNLP